MTFSCKNVVMSSSVHLDIAPQRTEDAVQGQIGNMDRGIGHGNVNDRCAEHVADQGILLAIARIGPTPDIVQLVVRCGGAEVAPWHEGL